MGVESQLRLDFRLLGELEVVAGGRATVRFVSASIRQIEPEGTPR